MIRTLSLFLAAALFIPAFAKDKKSGNYEMGTVAKLTVKSGWVDTTQCTGEIGNLHCSGGIEDSYRDVYILTLDNGAQDIIHHALMRPDTVKNMNLQNASTVPVMYRVQRHAGVDYFIIPDVDGKKEGWYYLDSHFHKPDAPTTEPAPKENVSNVKAMCDSGKLTAEQQKRYCADPPKN